MSSIHNLAWAAGIFEGEGTITTSKSPSRIQGDPPYVKLQLAVVMTDEDTMRRFHKAIGEIGILRNMHSPSLKNSGRQPVWSWRVTNRLARDAAGLFLPYFSARRAKQLADCMAACQRPDKRVGPR